MTHRANVGLLALSVFVVSFSSCKTVEKKVEFSIFHTNDIHSQMHAPRGSELHLGGMAKMATLLKTLRAATPFSLTLDAGDWSEGSWYYNLDTGGNMLRVLDAMDYDTVTLGNHDYLSGPARLASTVAEAHPRFPIIASNIDFSLAPELEFEFRKNIAPYTILERFGVKVGLIGLTTVDYAFAPYFKPLVVTDPLASAVATAKLVRPQVDLLFLISHNMFSTSVELAKAVPGVDAVFSGHSHVKLSKAVVVKNAGREVPVVETGCFGEFLGELKMAYSPNTKKIDFKGYALHPVLSSLDEDVGVAQIVAQEDQKIANLYGSDPQAVVAQTEFRLERADSSQASLGHLATKSFRRAVGADLSMDLQSLLGFPIPVGGVRVFDMHDVVPHIFNPKTGKDWTVQIWEARAQDLVFVLNAFLSVPDMFIEGKSQFLAVDGAELVLDPKSSSNPVSKLTEIKINGEEIDLAKTYQVALTDGLLLALKLANEKFHLGIDLSSVVDSQIEGWRAVLDYSIQEKTLNPERLRENGRVWTTLPDLAVYPFGISWTGTALRVEVQNDGKAAAQGGKVVCASGKANDYSADKTSEQVYTPIGSGEILSLNSGEKTKIEIPWVPAKSGFWPIRCVVESLTEDGYQGNDAAEKIIWNAAPAATP
ncbi:metallophosphoesterase [Bdellovibrionota bacterium FG-2]